MENSVSFSNFRRSLQKKCSEQDDVIRLLRENLEGAQRDMLEAKRGKEEAQSKERLKCEHLPTGRNVRVRLNQNDRIYSLCLLANRKGELRTESGADSSLYKPL